MLIQFFEYLFISLFNGLRKGSPRKPARQAASATPAGHVVLGETIPDEVAGESQEIATLSPSERRRHMYILGATGCGKTNLVMRLIESDLLAKRSLCVVDLRGDLIDRILIRLAATRTPDDLAGKVLLLDLRDEEQIVGFNPLAGNGMAYSRALHMLSVLRQQAESWGVQLDETLRNCLMALADSGWSLLELEPLLTNAAFRAEVLRKISDSYVRSFFERYDGLSHDKQMAWALPVLNKVTPLLAIPRLRLMFGQRQSFSFADLIDRAPGSVILVGLGADRMHGAAHLVGGLFVSAFQSAVMERANVPEAERIPIFFYLDEFETMASESFEAIVAEGRRFGLGLCLSHQNGHQIPTGLRHVLRNNVHTQLFFQTGAMDAADLASEIGDGKAKDETRIVLMGQQVGEAFLVRRGSPAKRVRIAHSPDPAVDPGAVSAIRRSALQAFGMRRTDIERELEERRELIRSLADGPAGIQQMEVRDVQAPKAPTRRRP